MATILKRPRKVATNVSLDADAVASARSLGINVSQACESGLLGEIKREHEARWRADNREAIASNVAFVERHGVPLARFRQY